VVCSLSIASSAVFTAVSKPNVVIVPLTSLSIVFGTQTILMPRSQSWLAMLIDPSPPIEMSESMPSLRAGHAHRCQETAGKQTSEAGAPCAHWIARRLIVVRIQGTLD